MWIKQWLNDLPRWPESLFQSVENPLQLDRLPADAAPELEYPTRKYSLAQDRSHTIWILFLATLPGLLLSVASFYAQYFRLTFYLQPACATIAIYLFLTACLGRKKVRWRWWIYFLVAPILSIMLFLLYEPYLLLALATFFSLIIADLFAYHSFALRTVAPMERSRMLHLRQLWANRFRAIARPAKGAELYPISLAAIPLAFIWLAYASRPVSALPHLPSLVPLLYALAALLLFPVAIELLASILYGRPPVRPAIMLKAVLSATVEWFTYNRQGTVSPGTFQSPAGTYRQRRRMSLAMVFLLAAAFAQLSTWTILSQFSKPAPDQTAQTAPPGQQLASSRASANPPAENSDSKQPSGGSRPTLQPYQAAMLDAMTPEDREAYLRRIEHEHDQAKRTQVPATRSAATTDAPADDLAARLDEVLGPLLRALRIACYVLLSVLTPTILLLACCFTASARVTGFFGQHFGTEIPRSALTSETWANLVRHLRTSRDETEQDSLFLGVNAKDYTPIIVPRRVFQEHAHLLGDSGSGKTSLGLAPMIAQLIDFRDSSLLILDLKADDLALFEGARLEAEAAGLRFRWFTNELHHPTYIFNPLLQHDFANLTLYQRTDVLTAALGLQYGTDYGRSYYSDACGQLLFHAFKACPNLKSFAQLAYVLNDPSNFAELDPKTRLDSSHLRTTVDRLSSFDPLNANDTTCDNPAALDSALQMGDLFRAPQVMYFHLASALGTTSSSEIARLALYSLLTAAKAASPERKQVYLFIDEFQRIVAHNLELFLQTARSMNIGVILANQTLLDLKTSQTDLIPTVRANTRFKQVFAASDASTQQELLRTSGETVVYSRSLSQYLGVGALSGQAQSLASTETITTRLRTNDILLATDAPLQSIVQITRGHGYAQYGGFPFIMTSAFHITPDQYRKRRTAAWPDNPPETITAPLPVRPTVIQPAAFTPVLPAPPPAPAPGASAQTDAPPTQTPAPAAPAPPAGTSPADASPPDSAYPLFASLEAHWQAEERRRKRAARKARRQSEQSEDDSNQDNAP